MMTLALSLAGACLLPVVAAEYGPLPEGAVLIGENYKFAEGPAIDREGILFFTDVRSNEIFKWKDGVAEVVATDTNGANGLAFDSEGNLYGCQGGAIGRLAGAKLEPVVTETDGKSLNQTNDIVIDGKGVLYFTNPGRTGESPIGVVRVGADGAATTIATDQSYPNGIALSPDEKWLYVNDTMGGAVTWRYALHDDGTVGAGEKFVDWGKGAPDGMAVAASGNVYICLNVSATIMVVSPEGKTLREYEFPKGSGVSNLCFGGADMKTIYVTFGNHGKVYAFPGDEPGLVLAGNR